MSLRHFRLELPPRAEGLTAAHMTACNSDPPDPNMVPAETDIEGGGRKLRLITGVTDLHCEGLPVPPKSSAA